MRRTSGNLPSIFGEHPLEKTLRDNFSGPFQGSLDKLEKFNTNNVVENENEGKLKIDVPGFSKDELDVNIDDEYLVVSGEKTDEFGSHKVYQKYSVPAHYENVDAKMENGVLLVTFKKPEQEVESVKKIEIT